MTNYEILREAVNKFYDGRDIFAELASKTIPEGLPFPKEEWYAAIEKVPGVKIVKNANGETVSAFYTGQEAVDSAIGNEIASLANSNIGSSVTGGMGTSATSAVTKVKAPINTTIQSGGVTAANTGVKTIAGIEVGSVTAGMVLSDIGAVCTAITLGKWIDYALYNIAPDFWDSHGMSTINPETWDIITEGLDQKDLSVRIVNMLFGLNPNTGEMQPYLDEDVFSYMAAYLHESGVFDAGFTSITAPQEIVDRRTFDIGNKILEITDIKETTEITLVYDYFTNPEWEGYQGEVILSDFKNSDSSSVSGLKAVLIDPEFHGTVGNLQILFISDENQSFTYKKTSRMVNKTSGQIATENTVNENSKVLWTQLFSASYTPTLDYRYYIDQNLRSAMENCVASQLNLLNIPHYGGEYVGVYFKNRTKEDMTYVNSVGVQTGGNKYSPMEGAYITPNDFYNRQPQSPSQGGSILALMVDYLDTMVNGTEESTSNIDGIRTQPNAKIPDLSNVDTSDISAVKQALQDQFPELWQNALKNTVINEDGTTTDKIYIPVGYPQVDPNNPTQPQGNIATQTKPQYDPEEDPDISEQIYTLIQYLPQLKPNPDTDPEARPYIPILVPDPVTNPNPPDTGEGDTPAIVIPAGSTSALFSVYNPTQGQVDSFGAWLWSNDFVDQLKKIFNDPMESIISLHKVFATPSTGASQDIYVGYLDSGVSSATVTNQYVDVDCGSITLYEYFGNVFDYENTSLHLYIPFVGFVNISTYDAMRSEIKVIYHIDVLTGECLVDVEMIRDLAGGVLYQYSGNCAVHYPVSAGSYIGLVGGLLSAAVGIGGSIATGGALAPALIGAGAGLMRAHTDVSRGGGFSGNSGAMGAKKPYIVITRPQTAVAEKYLELEGIGSNHTVMLNTVSGYVKIKDVQLHDINAYRSELEEIESLLRAGIII